MDMAHDTREVRYESQGTAFVVRRMQDGRLLIRLADPQTEPRHPGMEIRPKPDAAVWGGTVRLTDFFNVFDRLRDRLLDRQASATDPFPDRNYSLAKAVERAEDALRLWAAGNLIGKSEDEVGVVLDTQVDCWLEGRRARQGSDP